uniref:Small ribosomal subunit protein mS39 n=1 Tax=Gouania willdenowi TaxID=441366 RepID=A0A8C5N6A3_GOUWI
TVSMPSKVWVLFPLCKVRVYVIFIRSFSETLNYLPTFADVVSLFAEQEIIIPKKKTWSKVAVLEALASTVNRDPTAYPYQFQDDPYLSPRNNMEFKLFSLSQESGRAAAKYFVNNHPKFFTKDFAEPHIPCLMPETVTLCLEEVSEEALKERIQLRKVTAAVDMFDQLQQTGTAVSMKTIHNLLDLICLYCDKEPFPEEEPQTEETQKRRTGQVHRASNYLKLTWKENNNAERIFNTLPERDTRCYSALIRGMVKHGAHAKAFSLYTDLLNNRMTADVHIFNALILAAPDVREVHMEKWDLITELLKQMNEQKIRPNLQTFNNVLKALRRSGLYVRTQAVQVLNEMKAVGIAPSLASYEHILAMFYKPGTLRCVYVSECCFDYKDLELGYRVHSLLEVGENWRLLGDNYHQGIYYGRFFHLLCTMEHLEEVLKWYRLLVPSRYYLNHQSLRTLLQALDTESRLDLLPTIWKDMKTMALDNNSDLLDELLRLMTREEHSAEVRVEDSFADCVLDINKAFDSKPNLEWSTSGLTDATTLLLRASRTQKAWEMLQLFKSKNRVNYQVKSNPKLRHKLSTLSTHILELPSLTATAVGIRNIYNKHNQQTAALLRYKPIMVTAHLDHSVQ